MYTKLTQKQIQTKVNFIKNYISSHNASSGSLFDSNANVSNKNVATLEAELNKDINIQVNRLLISEKIKELFGEELSLEYVRQIEAHEIYINDETSLKPYCVSVTMYPLLFDGLVKLGGESKSPKHLASFCGTFVNFLFSVSSQFAGAVATVEFLMYFDYFAKKDYGENYLETHTEIIKNELQHVIYAINQPAAARGYQCVRENQTQLSTPNGFKYLSELKEGDECYVWNNGKILIEKIKKLNTYDYEGELLQFKGRNYQQTVTPNHRVVYKKPNSDEFNIKEAHELFGHSKLSLPIGSDGIDREDYKISDDLLQLCVVALTDGSIDNLEENNNFSGRLTIYKSPNRWGAKEIPAILEKNGIGYTISDTNYGEFGEVFSIRLTKVDSQIILRMINHTKASIPHFFKLLSSRQARLVIDTWVKLDGSNGLGKSNANKLLQCDNDEIREDLQEVAILAGYGSEIFNKKATKINSEEKCVVKYIKLFERNCKRVSEYNTINYKGKVWCPTTDSGVVIFREDNGIPYISGNSCFWNISLYDKYYFESLFEAFIFPDNSSPKYENVSRLQKFFMKWFNKEREKAVLTFPVITAATLTKDNQVYDKDFEDFCAEELSEGNSFFIYQSDNADTLSSCCRLQSKVADNTFSYSLGAGGVSTGSINVITLNMNRIIQKGINLSDTIDKVHKYQIAYRSLMTDYKEAGMLPVYDAGFISLDKQFLTIGINGMVEAAEYLGIEISDNDQYREFINSNLKIIYDKNKKIKEEYGFMFNTEFVPAENLGVKNAGWDRKDGLEVNRDCYNSYFYAVEDSSNNVLDKFRMHGNEYVKYLDGGSAYHCNLEEYPTKEGFKKLLNVAASTGCNYFCFNVKVTVCNDCDYINKHTKSNCIKCGSEDVDHATRIIGYLKKVTDYSKDRQKEEKQRYYAEI